MRAERLLRVLLLLQAHGRMTVPELARRLDVSARTVQRDLDALSLAGVPVYAVRGNGGGWELLPDYRTRLTGLTPAEAMSVFVGATAHVLSDLGLNVAGERSGAGSEESSGRALQKLAAVLPAGVRRDAEFARTRLLVDHAGWDEQSSTTPPSLEVCRQGLWEERKIRGYYRDRARSVTLAPLGLVAKARVWYLVAERSDGKVRTYRVDRIRSATLTERGFERPAGFDLAEHWARAVREFRGSLPSYRVVLRIRDELVGRFEPAGPVVADGPGWSVVEADLENAGEACSTVLSFAGDVTVMEPAELRTLVCRAARRIARSYA